MFLSFFKNKMVCFRIKKSYIEILIYDYGNTDIFAYNPGTPNIRRYGNMYENKLYNECIFMQNAAPRLIFNNYDYGWEYDSKYTYICNCIVEFIDGVIQYKIDDNLTSLTEEQMNMLTDKYISNKHFSELFESFFKTILELRNDSGPLWICNNNSKKLKNN